jgi:hypothetical protein
MKPPPPLLLPTLKTLGSTTTLLSIDYSECIYIATKLYTRGLAIKTIKMRQLLLLMFDKLLFFYSHRQTNNFSRYGISKKKSVLAIQPDCFCAYIDDVTNKKKKNP